MMLRRGLLILCLLALCAAVPIGAQSNAGPSEPFAWSAADLSFTAPSGWVAAGASDENSVTMTFTAPDGGRLRLIALPRVVTPESLIAAAQTAAESGGFAAARYDGAEWFGQPGFTGASATGEAVAARLPDGRGLLILGEGSAAEWVQRTAESVTFSDRSAPTVPAYHVVWGEPLPDPISFTDVIDPRIAGLVTLADGRLVVAEPARGLMFFQPGAPGADIIPFPNPSQPTGLALDSAGQLIISDPVCRCLQVYAAGDWAAPIGAFAGGAPHSVAAGANGALYAVDGDSNAYTLWVQDSAGERRIPLTFNAAAPPVLAAGGPADSPRLYVLEWLTSLMDGTVSVAVSDMRDDKLTLLGWLPAAPDTVRGAAVMPDGALVVALSGGSVARFDPESGSLRELANTAPGVPRAVTAAPDGSLFVGLESGDLLGFRQDGPPGRTGDGTLQADVPAQARIAEGWPAQTFTYAGRAGEVITINATDLLRQNTLDMAVTLTGPDGVELASNDDQMGLDLYGVYDAQIPAVTLPTDGDYRISVSPVAGEGVVTLGIAPDRVISIHADEPTRLEGALQDVFPAQRWAFDGKAGQVLTFTMVALDGDLDPLLELFTADGRRLALNDDAAEDLTLGNNAQLFRIQIPRDERYILKAGRYEGSGRYELVVVPNG